MTQTGVEFSTSPNFSPMQQVTGQLSSPFTVSLTGLVEGTLYFYRAFADTVCGRVYGLISSVTTGTATAIVITGTATGLTSASASIINNMYSGITGTVTGVGVQYSISPTFATFQATAGTIMQGFSVNLSGLSPSTTYYYRAYVNTSGGQTLGDIKSFITTALGGAI